MNVRRLLRLLPVLVLVVGLVGWQAAVSGAGPVEEPTTEPTLEPLTPPDDGGEPLPEPAVVEDPVTPLAAVGPVGYTNGFIFKGIPSDCDFFEVDLGTGVLTQKNTDSVRCADGYTFAPDGTLYAFRLPLFEGFSETADLVTVDPATGAQTVVGQLPPLADGGMTFDAAGNLYVYAYAPECDDTFCLYKIDPATAAATLVGGQEELSPGGLAATCTELQGVFSEGRTGPGRSGSVLERIDPTSGGVSTIVELPDIGEAGGLDYDSTGNLWALGFRQFNGDQQQAVFNIDTATGATPEVGVTLEGEPFDGVLFGLAVSGLSCALDLQPTFAG